MVLKAAHHVSCIVLFVLRFISVCSGLYNADTDRGIYILTNENFDYTVYRLTPGSQNDYSATDNLTWIIQFYNSWCGHCIKFSTVFKAVGNKTQYWNKYFKLGTVDCAYEDNRPLCTKFQVKYTPSIRVFPPGASNRYQGENIAVPRSALDMLYNVLDILEFNGVPEELQPLPHESIGQIWNGLNSHVIALAVIVEPIGSQIGKEVIMHLLPNLHVIKVRRTFSNNRPLLDSLSISNGQPPFIVFTERTHVGQKGVLTLESMFAIDPIEALCEAILRADTELTNRLGIQRRPRLGPVYGSMKLQPDRVIQKDPMQTPPVFTSANIQDLDSAIIYAFSNEVGRLQEVRGKELDALKLFLESVIKWVPVKPATRAALNHLQSKLLQETSVSGQEVIAGLREGGLAMDTDNLEWANCRGSVADRRGYPCGLWQVFHTITVRALGDQENSVSVESSAFGPKGSLTVVVGYIEHFFSCGECVQNFMKGVHSLRRSNVFLSGADAVLFLWRAHNNANRFLAGDFSEDPMYPKTQFPSLVQCFTCRKNRDPRAITVVWDEAKVLTFLKRFYGFSGRS